MFYDELKCSCCKKGISPFRAKGFARRYQTPQWEFGAVITLCTDCCFDKNINQKVNDIFISLLRERFSLSCDLCGEEWGTAFESCIPGYGKSPEKEVIFISLLCDCCIPLYEESSEEVVISFPSLFWILGNKEVL